MEVQEVTVFGAPSPPVAGGKPEWSAVFSMSLGVASLVTAELLPVSLLTPMARELHITEGVAGQTVTTTAVVALFASLLVAALTRRMDRRILMLLLTVMLIASNLVAAFAPNVLVLMLGRMLLGVALGGFWAMSTALTTRLVPETLIPRALSVLFAGVSVATIVAAPLGSYVGGIVGWRGVFLFAAGLGLVTLTWQFVSLPSMVPRGYARLDTLLTLLKRPQIGMGMFAVILIFAGHFAFFTYLRPFLEIVTGATVAALSAILLAFGIGNFVGTSAASVFIAKNLRMTLAGVPLLMAVLAFSLVAFGDTVWIAAAGVGLWGFAFGTVPVGWSTWLAKTVPDESESSGGLLVAAIQLAISIGAAGGGAIVEHSGVSGAIGLGGVLLLFATPAVLRGVQSKRAINFPH